MCETNRLRHFSRRDKIRSLGGVTPLAVTPSDADEFCNALLRSWGRSLMET